jgi:phosphoglycolate phosphatase
LTRYDLAIFDFDGTLANSAPWFRGTVNALAERFDFKPVDAAEYERLRGEDSKTIMQALGVPKWKLPRIARYVHRQVAKEWDQIPLFDGVDTLLERLSAEGVRLAMVSSNTKANVRRILGEENSARFEYFACGAGAFGKAAKFRRVVRKLKADPARTLAIGDEERDIKAAREAGIAAGSVAWGYAADSILKAGEPDHFFETIDDVIAAVCPAAASD